jgi:hypothetical protein
MLWTAASRLNPHQIFHFPCLHGFQKTRVTRLWRKTNRGIEVLPRTTSRLDVVMRVTGPSVSGMTGTAALRNRFPMADHYRQAGERRPARRRWFRQHAQAGTASGPAGWGVVRHVGEAEVPAGCPMQVNIESKWRRWGMGSK